MLYDKTKKVFSHHALFRLNKLALCDVIIHYIFLIVTKEIASPPTHVVVLAIRLETIQQQTDVFFITILQAIINKQKR